MDADPKRFPNSKLLYSSMMISFVWKRAKVSRNNVASSKRRHRFFPIGKKKTNQKKQQKHQDTSPCLSLSAYMVTSFLRKSKTGTFQRLLRLRGVAVLSDKHT